MVRNRWISSNRTILVAESLRPLEVRTDPTEEYQLVESPLESSTSMKRSCILSEEMRCRTRSVLPTPVIPHRLMMTGRVRASGMRAQTRMASISSSMVSSIPTKRSFRFLLAVSRASARLLRRTGSSFNAVPFGWQRPYCELLCSGHSSESLAQFWMRSTMASSSSRAYIQRASPVSALLLAPPAAGENAATASTLR